MLHLHSFPSYHKQQESHRLTDGDPEAADGFMFHFQQVHSGLVSVTITNSRKEAATPQAGLFTHAFTLQIRRH